MKIALGAARGLAFLHGAETKVIYRDFKTSNILLDSVCDFGQHIVVKIHCCKGFFKFENFTW